MTKNYDLGNDGGPAFPIADSHQNASILESGFNGVTVWNMGMSRRDYFAAAALAGGLEQGVEHDMAALIKDTDSWWHSPEKIASRAYAIADAMLEQSRYV